MSDCYAEITRFNADTAMLQFYGKSRERDLRKRNLFCFSQAVQTDWGICTLYSMSWYKMHPDIVTTLVSFVQQLPKRPRSHNVELVEAPMFLCPLPIRPLPVVLVIDTRWSFVHPYRMWGFIGKHDFYNPTATDVQWITINNVNLMIYPDRIDTALASRITHAFWDDGWVPDIGILSLLDTPCDNCGNLIHQPDLTCQFVNHQLLCAHCKDI